MATQEITKKLVTKKSTKLRKIGSDQMEQLPRIFQKASIHQSRRHCQCQQNQEIHSFQIDNQQNHRHRPKSIKARWRRIRRRNQNVRDCQRYILLQNEFFVFWPNLQNTAYAA